jgi:hypothetical protein
MATSEDRVRALSPLLARSLAEGRVLVNNPVRIRLLDRSFRLRKVVTRFDQKQGRVIADPAVVLSPNKKLVSATTSAAFADDAHALSGIGKRLGEPSDLLVDLTENGLVLRYPPFPFPYEAASS